MERCPNCGAPARPGAKFCTTCGYRLPVAVAVTPTTDSSETSTTATSSWPAPPVSATESDAADSSTVTFTSSEPGGSDVVIVSGSDSDSEPTDESQLVQITSTDDTSTGNTDEVLSSSWPSTASADQASSWSTGSAGEVGGESGAPADGEGGGVSEETVVVSEPASQYEGWSAAVVEEVSGPSESAGTNIARATALLDELRLLLPVLNAGSAAGAVTDESLMSALESAVASAHTAAAERQALREALNEARDNPRDIQTILALSSQAGAAIALLDEHERLIAAIEPAIAERPSPASGIYPTSK